MRSAFAVGIAAFSVVMLLCSPSFAAPTHDITLEDVLDGNVPGVTASSFRGNGTYGSTDSLVGTFRNETGQKLRMYVPPGMYFSPSDAAKQPLITGGCVVEIPPTQGDATTDVAMTAYCGDHNAGIPQSETGFTYEGFVPDDQRTLLENGEREGTDPGSLQGYVWQMTNGDGTAIDETMQQLLEGGKVDAGTAAAAGVAGAGAAAGASALLNRLGEGGDGQTPPPDNAETPGGPEGEGESSEGGEQKPEGGDGEGPEKPPPEEEKGEKAEGEGGEKKDKPKTPEWLIFTDPQTGKQTWKHGNDVYQQDEAGRWVRQADADKQGGTAVTVGGANLGEQGGLYSASSDRGGRRTDVVYDARDHAGGYSEQQGKNRTSAGFDDGRTDLTITRGRGEGERTTSANWDNRDGTGEFSARQGDNILNAQRAADGSFTLHNQRDRGDGTRTTDATWTPDKQTGGFKAQEGDNSLAANRNADGTYSLDNTRDRGDIDRTTHLDYNPGTRDGSFSATQGDNKATVSHTGDQYQLQLNRDRDVNDRATNLTYDTKTGAGSAGFTQGDNELTLGRDDKGAYTLGNQRDRGEGTRNFDASWNPDTREGGFTSREGDNLLSANQRADGTIDVGVGRSRTNIDEETLTRGASYNPRTGDASVQVGQGDRDVTKITRTGDRTEVSVTRPRGDEGTISTSAAYDPSKNAGSFTQTEGQNKVDLQFDPEQYKLQVNSERSDGEVFSRSFEYRPQEDSGGLTLGNVDVGHKGSETWATVGPRTIAYDSEQRMGGFAWETPKGDGYTGVKVGERWGVEGSRPLGSGNIEWNYEQGGPSAREWKLEWSIGEGDDQFGVGVQTDSTGHPMPTVRGVVKF